MEFNKQNIKTIRNEIDAMFEEYGKQRDIQLSIGDITFSNNRFTTRLEAIAAGSSSDAERVLFEKYEPNFGLCHAYGKKFKSQKGEIFTAVKLKPKSPKYPLVGENAEGKRYKFRLTVDILDQLKKIPDPPEPEAPSQPTDSPKSISDAATVLCNVLSH